MLYTKYWFWLILIALSVTLSERIFPWRKEQKLLRPQLLQDIFWIAFNGYLFGRFFGFSIDHIYRFLSSGFERITGTSPYINLLGDSPFIIKVALSLLVMDFIEWMVHNLLHRVNWLWSFHRVHHSIHIMDWIGNFRFHWMELVIYNTFKFLPIAIINGGNWKVLLTAGIISTIIGNLNHSNLDISWGPLRYIFNSPRMHIWHHDKKPKKIAGYNFAVVFSFWDWLFQTAYMPPGQTPEQIGFWKDEQVSENLLMRFFMPFVSKKK